MRDTDGKSGLGRYLLVALWPAGQSVIGAVTLNAVRRASRRDAPPDGGPSPARSLGPVPLGVAGRTSLLGAALTRPARSRSRQGRQGGLPGLGAVPDWVPGMLELGAISGAGGVLAYRVMRLLGPTVLRYGPKIDEPIVRWTSSHQVDWWAHVIERLGKIGNTWTTWGAGATAGACLSVAWKKHKWLPPAALASVVLVDKYATLALRRKFRRVGPPESPGGTYPSGGCDRVVLFYGLIAYMLWREFDGTPRGQAWATGIVASLAFNEACSRQYLSKHWFTDIVTGVFYGALLLAPFIAAVRLIAGPPALTAGNAGPGLPGA